jgi:hypothetical protein
MYILAVEWNLTTGLLTVRPEAGLALPVLRPQVEKEIGGQKQD